MKLSGQQTLPVSQAQAWAALNDTAMLQAALPGCESITPAGDNAFDVLMAVSIGPVKAKFKGRLQLSDLDPPNGYRLSFEGSGGAAGHGKGQADVRLEALSPRETRLGYDVTASVGGKLAQIGSRLIDGAAQKVAEDFFERFRATLQQQQQPAVAAAAPARAERKSRLLRLREWLRRLFG
ncbi:MAG: carbon monoxide dehydrogenase subunit G [Burkholderiales bacterium]|jgi:carbon monoxide dehydrogenase subunit G|nr:carbon monoxide dehydrogenase subunit G [Burkholderiales bacterium]